MKKTKTDIKKIFKIITVIIIVGSLYQTFVSDIIPTSSAINLYNNKLPEAEDIKDPTIAQQIRIIASKECGEMGEFCIKDLLAMAWVESAFNCEAVGDFGASHGCYQIHQGYHNVKQADAENLNFAISWTLNRLKHYGYPVYRSRAIMKHNGTPNTPKTLTYLNKINNYINN